MRRSATRAFHSSRIRHNQEIRPERTNFSKYKEPPIVCIQAATFYRHHPTAGQLVDNPNDAPKPNPPLFRDLNLEIPSFSRTKAYWSIVGPSSSGKTTLLQILQGEHLCFPPTARSYPYLSTDRIRRKDPRLSSPGRAIQYVDFSGERGGSGGSKTRGAYLSARYESRREEADFSLMNYLKGNTELNPLKRVDSDESNSTMLNKVIADLRLGNLVDMPVRNLSNGQMRRAKIAKALLGRPELLLLDEPFMGLDPPTCLQLSPLLGELAASQSPRIVMSLRPQDPIPSWITHLVRLGDDRTITHQGPKKEVLKAVRLDLRKEVWGSSTPMYELGRTLSSRGVAEVANKERRVLPTQFQKSHDIDRESLVEMNGVKVAYGERKVIGDWEQQVNGEAKQGLWWNVRRGDRWGIFGPNGSGKTTLISLICSDHPQTYSLPIRLFGNARLPTLGSPGISIFDIQARIGHSSPEIHAFFPRTLTIRQTVENAWADTFLGKARLDHQRDRDVDACLHWFRDELNPSDRRKPVSDRIPERESWARMVKKPKRNDKAAALADVESLASPSLDWADQIKFGEITFSAQRVALFLRAIIKKPDLLILDEAFSGMDGRVRDRCLDFMTFGTDFTAALAHSSIFQLPPEDTIHEYRARGLRFSGLEERQALICVSHVREEVPNVIQDWMCLPEPGTRNPPRFGVLDVFMRRDLKQWNDMWNLQNDLRLGSREPHEKTSSAAGSRKHKS